MSRGGNVCLIEYLWPKISLDTGAPLAHLLPSSYERSKCFGRGGAKPLLYASKMWLAALSFKKAPFPRPRPSKRKKSSCERLSSLFLPFGKKTCLGLDKQANQERMIFFERGGGDCRQYLQFL